MGKGSTSGKGSRRKDGKDGSGATGGRGQGAVAESRGLDVSPDGQGREPDGPAGKDRGDGGAGRKPDGQAVPPEVAAGGTGSLSPPTRDPMPDGAPKSKRTGRPKGTKAEKEAAKEAETLAEVEANALQLEADAVELSVVAGEMLRLPFSYVATRRGEHWRLSGEESSEFSIAVCRVIVKYLPDIVAKYKVEAFLVLTTASIVGPRIRKDIDLAAERKRAGSPKLRGDRPTGLGEVDPSSDARGTAA